MIPKKADFDAYRLALRRIESEAKAQKNWLPKACATEYRDELTKAIITQKYISKWKSTYHPWYADWKKMMTGSTGKFWILFGDLLRSITTIYRPAGGKAGWFTGVPSGAKDSGGKSWFGTKKNPRGKRKSIVMYASVGEETRPVFGPSADDYAAGNWIRRASNSLNAIARLWR
jgi:hypothetical protein